jgi:CHASE2 domain-containing sensor protein
VLKANRFFTDWLAQSAAMAFSAFGVAGALLLAEDVSVLPAAVVLSLGLVLPVSVLSLSLLFLPPLADSLLLLLLSVIYQPLPLKWMAGRPN